MNRFESFVSGMESLVASTREEAALLKGARPLLAELITNDDWLAPEHAKPGENYRQYLLHRDPQERFSVVSFVWGPGQVTPIHDHTVWGLVGVMRGAELCREYERNAEGRIVPAGREHLLEAGHIEAVSPTVGDIHTVANGLSDRPSVSIHVYGADIGRVKRHWYDPATGEAHDFVSGYTNAS